MSQYFSHANRSTNLSEVSSPYFDQLREHSFVKGGILLCHAPPSALESHKLTPGGP